MVGSTPGANSREFYKELHQQHYPNFTAHLFVLRLPCSTQKVLVKLWILTRQVASFCRFSQVPEFEDKVSFWWKLQLRCVRFCCVNTRRYDLQRQQMNFLIYKTFTYDELLNVLNCNECTWMISFSNIRPISNFIYLKSSFLLHFHLR